MPEQSCNKHLQPHGPAPHHGAHKAHENSVGRAGPCRVLGVTIEARLLDGMHVTRLSLELSSWTHSVPTLHPELGENLLRVLDLKFTVTNQRVILLFLVVH